MLTKLDLKLWLRSRSRRFMLDARPQLHPNSVGTYHWRGKPIYFRRGASEMVDIYKILLKTGKRAEYSIPFTEKIETIFDIGANIGVTSLYFANLFPNARIFAFEPVPSNFELLSKNIQPYPNIKAFPIALGDTDGHAAIYHSDSSRNFGGFSFFQPGSDIQKTLRVEVRDIRAVIRELGITKSDLIKIDTEGSEYRILMALEPHFLQTVQWITGELHGERDFELLAFLSQWFDIGLRKEIHRRLFNFTARRKRAG